jgi:Nif-specific regulatory protein/two-component system response regulator HydG
VDSAPTVNLATELLEVARLVLLQDEDPRLIERLFRRIMNVAGAHRGYVVTREGDGFVEKFELNFSRAGVSQAERRFSRTLVRTAMQEKDIKHTANVHQDQAISSQGSVLGLAPASVVVIPLTAAGEVYGAIYLERPVHLKLTDEVRDFLHQAAEMAGQAIRRQLTSSALRQRNASLERDLFARHNFEGIITRDRAMVQVLETVAQVAEELGLQDRR